MNEQMPLTTVGGRIKAMRKKKNYSQRHIANELGVSISAVSLWEKNKANITSDKIATLAQVLNCDIEWLLNGTQSKNRELEYTATKEYRQGKLLDMCRKELMEIPSDTVEHAVHLLQIAAGLEEPYMMMLLKSATDLSQQQLWNNLTDDERKEFSNWLNTKGKK